MWFILIKGGGVGTLLYFILFIYLFQWSSLNGASLKKTSNFRHSTRRKFAFCTFKTNLLKFFSFDTFVVSKKVVGLRLWDKRVMKKIGHLGCYCMAPNFDLMIGSTKTLISYALPKRVARVPTKLAGTPLLSHTLCQNLWW